MNAIVSTACPACAQALQNPLTGAYRADCFECSASMVGRIRRNIAWAEFDNPYLGLMQE